MSWEKKLSQRLVGVVNLSKKCIKYLKEPEQAEEELLTRKVIMSIAKKVCEKREPVKLREIVDGIYPSVTKREMDIVRQLIKKALIPCGIVEKLSFGKKDIRYLLKAYRFQETRKVYSNSGQFIREPIGPIIEIPREHFPIPPEILQLLLSKRSYARVLSELDEDFGHEKISEMLYLKFKTEYESLMENVREKLKEHDEIVKLLDLDD